MKIDHIAIACCSESDSDKFFIDLLGLKKVRTFRVSSDLMEKFFGVKKEQEIIRYENDDLSVEVFITNDDRKAKDIFTHSCLIVKNRDKFVEKASSMGFTVIKVPRKNSDGYYLFIKDSYQNLYEIKE
jgi:catechol 2,3-dioxygenase-like lactoylglutathione lyase family enzyme